jgi:hypothetical protein
MGEESEGRRYRAFISYSHRDAVFGRRLHRRLESYAMPRRLVGRPTPLGQAPARLAPIFRDREELPAAHDLTVEVRAALQASDSLIVVCSPAAAASPWVSREIELFRKLHPDRPILAALIDGEPAEAFPAALHAKGSRTSALEPLAADFRTGRDGPRLALLKLVAGVVGVGLDQLVQRDAQRRVRRVTAVTAVALGAMLAMGVLTAFALSARAEADRQRAEAEGMVEFMLTDLRDKLKGVGRLDVMTSVNERALGYYRKQKLDHLPPASLERRARILHAMGEDDERRGDLDTALAKFVEAKRTTSVLLDAAPANPQRIYDHAQSEYWAAFVDWRRGNIQAARSGFERYAALASRLLRADASNLDWRMEGAYANSNLGMLILRDGDDPAAAEALFTRALETIRSVSAARPADAGIKRELADSYAWLSDSQLAQRRYEQARSNRHQEARLLKELLAADPKNVVFARDLLGNAMGLAQIDLDQGLPLLAAERLQAAYAEAGRLAATDPSDQKLAKQKIILGLVLTKSRLAAQATAASVGAALPDCRRPVITGDVELHAFCSIIERRVAIYVGGPSPPYPVEIPNIQRSARWGIDFAREASLLRSQRRRDSPRVGGQILNRGPKRLSPPP